VLKKLVLFCCVAVALVLSAPIYTTASSTKDVEDLKKSVNESINLLEKENKAFYETLKGLRNLTEDPNANTEDARGALRGYFKVHERKTLATVQAIGSFLDFQKSLIENWEDISPKDFRDFMSWSAKKSEKIQKEARPLTEEENITINKAFLMTHPAAAVFTTP